MISQKVVQDLKQCHLGEILLINSDKYVSLLVLCKFQLGKIYLTPPSSKNIIQFDNFKGKVVEIHLFLPNSNYFVTVHGKFTTMNIEQDELLADLKSFWIARFPQFRELFSIRKRFSEKLEVHSYFKVIPNQITYWNIHNFERESIPLEIIE